MREDKNDASVLRAAEALLDEFDTVWAQLRLYVKDGHYSKQTPQADYFNGEDARWMRQLAQHACIEIESAGKVAPHDGEGSTLI